MCAFSGSIAENAGLKVGDILLYVNSQMVSDLSHVDLVGVIKQVCKNSSFPVSCSHAGMGCCFHF